MAILLSDWIEQTRDHLLSGFNEPFNRLDGDITTDDTSLTLTYPPDGIQTNTDICIGLEVMHVWAISGNTLTVERKWKGKAANHYEGNRVYLNTRYSAYRIVTELNNELGALSSRGLYGIGYDTLTFSSDSLTTPFDPEAAFRSILQLRRMTNGSGDWPIIQGELVKNMPEDLTDGIPFAIRFSPGSAGDGDTILVVYKKNLTALERPTDNVLTTGLPETAVDIPPMGAAVNIALSREILRNDFEIQGDPRRSDEVPANAVANSAKRLQERYNERIASEKKSLNEDYVLAKKKLKNAAIMMSANKMYRTWV